MAVLGIDEVNYRAADLAACKRFFLDWGLLLERESDQQLEFRSLNDCVVRVSHPDLPGLPAGLEEGPTLVEVVWGVENAGDLDQYAAQLRNLPGFRREAERLRCQDPCGLSIALQVSRKRPLQLDCARFNSWSERPRVDQRAPVYERAQPIEVGHVVLFVDQREAMVRFYCDRLGFALSDQYPQRGSFLRCAPRGGHHDLFLLQLPSGKKGLNHVAFAVRDIHEVIGGGLAMDRLGWKTELGPGRHPISSAYFWYFENPAGGLVEYYSDEDELTEAWQPRDFEPGPERFAEWAVTGGLDGHTRRPKHAETPRRGFLTDKTGETDR